jgi:hypothetical protein
VGQVDQDAAGFSRLGLRLSQPELEELRSRIGELLNEYATRPATPGGEPYSIFVALHPDPSRD